MGTIRVANLSKAYKQYPTRWSRLIEWLFPFSGTRHQLKWVLQDIIFHVAAGEALGIIGMNGAGKSTLLKLITGTSQATTGSITKTGRVAAMLELGMGFHPDFSGRQNVLMAGQLSGLGTEEIAALMPQIEAFADIGEYIDQPVRVYSSGMQMRLAFSVATARRPDVLIVDEALSVGDAYFQHKSFDRIREFRKQGTTLLIVSHDRVAIQSICDRAILLDGGRLAKEGSPEEVMDFYNALIAKRENSTIAQEKAQDGRTQTTSGTGEASIVEIVLVDERGEIVKMVEVGAVVTLRVKVQANVLVPRLVLGYMIKDRLGQPIYGINTHHLGMPLHDVPAGNSVEYGFTFTANLGEGSYSVAVALTSSDTHLSNNYEWRDMALMFTVINTSKPVFAGCAWLEPAVTVQPACGLEAPSTARTVDNSSPQGATYLRGNVVQSDSARSPFPGRRLTTLAEVDKALRLSGEARQVSENNFLEKLRSFWLDFPPVTGDPWSLEYRKHWWTVYENLAGKPYEVQNEFFDFDVEQHVIHPYPYCTQDFRTVSRQLTAIGKIIEALALPPGSSILEMGAGWGNTSLLLAQMGYRVTVLDINPKYGELISKRAKALNVEIAFACLGYEDAAELKQNFDCVLFFESFHHAYDHLKLLDAIPALLAPNGVLALAGEPLNESMPYDWGLNPAGEALWQIRTHGWFELVFRESYLRTTLERKGFSVKKFESPDNPVATTFVCRLR